MTTFWRTEISESSPPGLLPLPKQNLVIPEDCYRSSLLFLVDPFIVASLDIK